MDFVFPGYTSFSHSSRESVLGQPSPISIFRITFVEKLAGYFPKRTIRCSRYDLSLYRFTQTYVSVRSVSRALSISFHFLTSIFQPLTSNGPLLSYRGPNYSPKVCLAFPVVACIVLFRSMTRGWLPEMYSPKCLKVEHASKMHLRQYERVFD